MGQGTPSLPLESKVISPGMKGFLPQTAPATGALTPQTYESIPT